MFLNRFIKKLQAFFKLMAVVLILGMVYLESYLQAILISSLLDVYWFYVELKKKQSRFHWLVQSYLIKYGWI